jgi:hypothetical protein
LKIAPYLARVLPALLALIWAGAVPAEIGTSGGVHAADGAVITATTVPSIEILSTQTHLAGSCSGAPFDLNTLINVDTMASADVRLTAPGIGVIEEFTDETGTNIGPYNGVYPTFRILGYGGGIAPHTAVQLSITTFTGPTLTGNSSFISTVTFDCTTGVISNIVNGTTDGRAPVPTTSHALLVAMSGLLALLGAMALRRRRTVSARPSRAHPRLDGLR